jgi:hypothetical protein
MEHKLWSQLYEMVMTTLYPDPAHGVRHSDRWVVLTYLWAVVHDRATWWATDRRNWPSGCGPLSLPSQPTMSRRLRTEPVRRLIYTALARCRAAAPAVWVKYLDGKPLPVGGLSKDPDARDGYGAGGYFRGYKLHAIWGAGPVPLAWEVRSANQAESTLARWLVRRLVGEGYLVGDSAYDSNPLYECSARRHHQVVAPPKKAQGAGAGHHRQSPSRLRSLELLGHAFGQALYKTRSAAERCFGHLTSFGGGLGPLPSWVRRLPRVRLWVAAKLLIYAARVSLQQGLVA